MCIIADSPPSHTAMAPKKPEPKKEVTKPATAPEPEPPKEHDLDPKIFIVSFPLAVVPA